MKINKSKLGIALANKQMRACDIKSISRDTYDRAMRGGELNTATVGRLAKELGVDAADIVEIEERR